MDFAVRVSHFLDPVSFELQRDVILLLSGGHIVETIVGGEVSGGLDGLAASTLDLDAAVCLPGFVNCHAHLDLSHLWRQVPRGLRFHEWAPAIIAGRQVAPSIIQAGIDDGCRMLVASGENLSRIVGQTVAPGSALRTDGWKAYEAVPEVRHQPEVVGDSKRASTVLPLVHRVASLLKRHVKGILHGSWRPEWLGWMLEDWEFRFNRRKAKRRPLLFERLLEWGARLRVPTRKDWHDCTLATRQLRITRAL